MKDNWMKTFQDGMANDGLVKKDLMSVKLKDKKQTTKGMDRCLELEVFLMRMTGENFLTVCSERDTWDISVIGDIC